MYQLDTEAARSADSIGAYLTDSGKYIGKFTRAEKLISKYKGTHGIGFTFDADGQTARFDLWTMDSSNKHLMGFKAVNAIMACLALRSINPSRAQIERYNWDTKETEKVDAEIFADLMGKPIGLVLQKTQYEKMRNGQKTGETGWRLELVAPYRASDGFTSSEILDRTAKPEKLDRIMAMLKDRPLKNQSTSALSANHDAANRAAASAGSGFDDMDDDIPF